MIDSHCHLASHKFTAEELPEIIARASERGITRMVTLATCLEDAVTNISISEKFPSVFTAIGIHPCDVHETPDDYMPTLRGYAAHEKCVAIGETGLDYYHPAPEGWSDDTYHQRQRDFLRQHFELARELGKNIVIHTRDRSGKQSMDDAVEIYRDYAEDVKAVFHCFLGPWENAQEVIALGGYISFTGIATFKSAQDCIQAAVNAPAGRFMVETDAPYLAPTPYRGKRNEPAFTLNTGEAIAAARGESLDEFTRHTDATAEKFFNFPG